MLQRGVGLRGLGFGLLALRDVAHHAEQPLAPAVVGAPARRLPMQRAVGGDDAVLDVEFFAGRERTANDLLHPVAVGRVDALEHAGKIGQRSGRCAGTPGRSARQPLALSFDVHLPHRQARRASGQAHVLLALQERGRRVPPPAPLDQERGDESGLQQHDHTGKQHPAAIGLP